VPASPLGAPLSKAVLSASGDTLYVLGAAKTGGVSAYDVATGKLTASYSHGGGYSGLYLLPSGTLLAVSAANPRLTFYSSSLSPLGTVETSLQISAAF
jgi:WD40 repeat protein